MEVLGSEWYLAPGAKLEFVEIVRDKHSKLFSECLIGEVGRSLSIICKSSTKQTYAFSGFDIPGILSLTPFPLVL
jgi:hypothetical protein